MVIAKYEKVEWNSTDVLAQTKRAEGGFGHTGI
jgi:dUTPase